VALAVGYPPLSSLSPCESPTPHCLLRPTVRPPGVTSWRRDIEEPWAQARRGDRKERKIVCIVLFAPVDRTIAVAEISIGP
jgi:hypothetical protein